MISMKASNGFNENRINPFIKPLKKPILCLLSLILLILLTSFIQTADAKENIDLNKMQNKIAKSYSNKFCNAIGIGMSKESSMKLTIIENSKLKYNPSIWMDIVLKRKANLEEINESNFSNVIYEQIIEDCGPALENIAGSSMQDFKGEFISQIENSKESGDN